ncbi:MAG: hypothetical protein ABJG42_24600 [Vibrio splendidus]
MNLQKSVKVSAAMTETNINDLAANLGITRVWLWKKLSENNPKYIGKMAMFYGVSVSEFIKRGE